MKTEINIHSLFSPTAKKVGIKTNEVEAIWDFTLKNMREAFVNEDLPYSIRLRNLGDLRADSKQILMNNRYICKELIKLLGKTELIRWDYIEERISFMITSFRLLEKICTHAPQSKKVTSLKLSNDLISELKIELQKFDIPSECIKTQIFLKTEYDVREITNNPERY